MTQGLSKTKAGFRRLSSNSSIAQYSLEQFPLGMILTDADRRIIEFNRAAERILERGDGLVVLRGRVAARRAFETDRLSHQIATATDDLPTHPAEARMTVGRSKNEPPYMVVVVPANERVTPRFRGALILVAGPEETPPSAEALHEFFGLSSAEARIVIGLMAGKRLLDITRESDVHITTLRTQLSSVFRKVGVKRQADLLRVVTNMRLLPHSP